MSDLAVNLYGEKIGTLTRRGNGVAFTADTNAIDKYGLNTRLLSQSIPLQREPIDASAFVGGLLPEGVAMQNLQRSLGPGDHPMFELISSVGRDVAGAITFGSNSEPEHYEPMTEEDIAAKLDRALDFPLGEPTGGSSLAGFQRKIALTRRDGQWLNRSGSGSSTHILKPGPTNGEPPTALHSEQYALELGRQLGLVVTDSYVTDFNGRPTLVIERFDRVAHDDGTITRIHQEDTAQALGLQWNDEYAKFQLTAGSRATLANIAAIADQRRSVFEEPTNRKQLLRYLTFNTALGNSDAHAKNYGLLRYPDGTTSLTPLYDIAPLTLSYDARKSNALWVNGVKTLGDVSIADLTREATGWGIKAGDAEKVIHETLEALAFAVETTDAHPSINDRVPGFILGQTYNLLEGKTAATPTPIPISLQTTIAKPAPPNRLARRKDVGQPGNPGKFAMKQWRDAEITL